MTPRQKKEKKNAKPDEAEAAAAPEETVVEETLEDWRDRALRAQAEMANMRRRLDQDVEDRTRMRLESVLHDVITLADHMELALGSLPEGLGDQADAKPFVDGVRAIHASLGMVFARHGLEIIQPTADQAFDSESHEAVRIESDESLDAPQLQVVRPGYRIGKRILRPAQVILRQPPEATDDDA